jgi:hypothetical protein
MAPRGRLATLALTALLALAVSVAACSQTPPSPASPAASSAFAPSTPSGSTAASDGLAPSELPGDSPASPVARQLCAKAFEPCDLTPGTYSTAPFDHPFRFTVGDGWTNVWYGVHGGWNELLPYGRWWWASGIRAGSIDGQTVAIGSTPTDFIDHLKRFNGLTLTQPKPVSIGGQSVIQVDVTVNEDTPEMFSIDDNAFNLGAGETVRFDLFDVSGQTVVLVLEAVEASRFGELVDRTLPMHDSITWDP